ncbi:bifunctional DNA primase/polymerase [Nocardia sp. XZ_19_369]|uniref:bifunctional DNA primase/polymerase n=1 Tax=Nocardia sp. XZ_19_369 TaxID=2769487 RepID=UPI0018906A47|nr:bifunctional DNA primase/polymerase [Nocardia sp. XZ_19_369]
MTVTATEPDLTELDSPRAAALSAAARGWPVFPLSPGRKQPPIFKNWPSQASTDPSQIQRWWSWNPSFNVAIATGPARLHVIDLDSEHLPEPTPDLTHALAQLAEHLPQPAPLTLTVATPHGWHLYYRAPQQPLPCTIGRIAIGVDSRGRGGYIVAPGSRTPAGIYQVVRPRPIVELSPALITALAPPPPPTISTRAVVGNVGSYLGAILSGEADRVTHARPGTRNLALFGAALRLGRLIAAGELCEHTARTVLTRAAEIHVGIEGFTAGELDRAVSNGFRYGAKHPRRLHH